MNYLITNESVVADGQLIFVTEANDVESYKANLWLLFWTHKVSNDVAEHFLLRVTGIHKRGLETFTLQGGHNI